jgi:uncharacterized protein (DUF427 family)
MTERPKESVWDYPRPPAVERVDRHIRAIVTTRTIADTRRPIRVLETSHPPAYYLPQEDVMMEFLVPSRHTSFCEYKGTAHYHSLMVAGVKRENVAWYYPQPSPGYEEIAGYIAFYAWAFDEVTVDGEQVTPQPGHFYGGWITSEIVGPFKGSPGTLGW